MAISSVSIFVLLICCPNVCGQNITTHKYGIIQHGKVGQLLKDAVDEKNSSMNSIFKDVSKKKRSSLYDELNKAVKIDVIHKVLISNAQTMTFSEKWTPEISMVGRTSGIISKQQLGTETDYFYKIEPSILSTRYNKSKKECVYLINITLIMNGRGLGIIDKIQTRLKIHWQFYCVVPVERVLKSKLNVKRKKIKANI